LFRDHIAVLVFGTDQFANDVGWLAIAVALSVATGAQTAFLNGMSRIDDLARVTVWGSVVSSVLGVATLLVWGTKGIIGYVLIGPFTSFILGHIFVARIAKDRVPVSTEALREQWRSLLRLGVPFMLGGLASGLAQLYVRSAAQQSLGGEALGYFQAAWNISMTQLSLILGAMSTDFYPRLTREIGDHGRVKRLVNEQTEVAFLLGAPFLIVAIGFTPWVIRILYSDEFLGAVELLRWQIVGDILKIASWPLGFVMLAAGDGRSFLLCEAAALAIFAALAALLLPRHGITGVGIAFTAMYLGYLPLVYWLARKRAGFRWDRHVVRHAVTVLFVAVVVWICSLHAPYLGMAIAAVAAAAFATFAFRRLRRVTG
jgi:O-antigen/teichoic acid export membrane protein